MDVTYKQCKCISVKVLEGAISIWHRHIEHLLYFWLLLSKYLNYNFTYCTELKYCSELKICDWHPSVWIHICLSKTIILLPGYRQDWELKQEYLCWGGIFIMPPPLHLPPYGGWVGYIDLLLFPITLIWVCIHPRPSFCARLCLHNISYCFILMTF